MWTVLQVTSWSGSGSEAPLPFASPVPSRAVHTVSGKATAEGADLGLWGLVRPQLPKARSRGERERLMRVQLVGWLHTLFVNPTQPGTFFFFLVAKLLICFHCVQRLNDPHLTKTGID
jgi:hypothetical protein